MFMLVTFMFQLIKLHGAGVDVALIYVTRAEQRTFVGLRAYTKAAQSAAQVVLPSFKS
jgi:hypothetical protein